ncbi:hypothetical protein [Chromobacterium sp. LK11]|uniref:hypothetical protein n=1 Tax=Chromobacterium sp. LK11 TaxID=1628212 RepID=UPI0012E24425|nr:hypothetical protein [Chromobacterium sp. LK11]
MMMALLKKNARVYNDLTGDARRCEGLGRRLADSFSPAAALAPGRMRTPMRGALLSDLT